MEDVDKSKRDAARRNLYRKHGLCIQCGQAEAASNRKRCARCLYYQRTYMATSRKAKRDAKA